MKLTLPDGKELSLESGSTGLQAALAIGPGLAKKAIAIECDGILKDLHAPITADAKIRILTARDDDAQALLLLRHSAAHLMAQAICNLHPGTRLAYGPALEDGFYYDMKTPRALSPEDFPAIEAEMQRLVAANQAFVRVECSPDEGLKRVGEDLFKRDNAERALAKGASTLSFYKSGDSFEDLCMGPHVPATGILGNVKLLSVAGAYWHGDKTAEQLTRVYGIAFFDAKTLKKYVQMIEESKARDHRRLGKELDLFHLEDENPGQIYWHPKGWSLWLSIEQYMRSRINQAGYVEVKTPALQPQTMWERSGHWAKYRQNMFITFEQDRTAGRDGAGEKTACCPGQAPQEEINRCFALKPMNCPGHILIFKQGLKSYRDLPLRMAEFGSCVRYEPSGALHGILRVRGFVQDDAHIFCTEEQIGSEVADFCALLKSVYKDFGFDPEAVTVKFSTRPAMRVGSDADWDRAEKALETASLQAGLKLKLHPGEGAFYGPKLEFVLTDCLGRDWQCGTIQVDFQLTSEERLDATYVASDGSRKHPVILHRAVLGSLERFIGILIEQYAGKFPLWLAPEQLRILAVSDEHLPYTREVAALLRHVGIRVEVDDASEPLGAKIRRARQDRVGSYAVAGAQEMTDKTLTLHRGNGDKLGAMSVEAVKELILKTIAARSQGI